MTLLEAESQARRFWSMVGCRADCEDRFPRDLVSAIAWALPVCVVMIPDLDTRLVRKWLAENQIGVAILCADRRLRGSLVAARGAGAILIDASDGLEQRRFTLAHELAHFLLEYFWPRQRALRALGERVRPVLDGGRQPTGAEQMSAILRGVVLGTLTHLMDRDPFLRIRSDRVLQAEDTADALAIELLAPHRRVIDEVAGRIRGWRDRGAEPETMSVLRATFGLPADVAGDYAKRLVDGQRGRTSFREWLGPGPAGR